MARQGKCRHRKTRQDKVRQCNARQGMARQGMARQGKTMQGMARQGTERQYGTRQSKTRQTMARQSKEFVAWQDKAIRGRQLCKTKQVIRHDMTSKSLAVGLIHCAIHGRRFGAEFEGDEKKIRADQFSNDLS